MHSAEEQQNKLLQAQIDIGRKLASSTEQDELPTQILHLSKDIFGFENAIIRLSKNVQTQGEGNAADGRFSSAC
ncbi:hypothetical protein C2E25_12490 [Geothermobacter hydrogeniphilus]|uniref:Uncharacterized protein n=1 Tax=Geothermobacter hydrogeniphilus TaxID=1969733 RepID=A0A2K2H833_9BACT|nr:hypothetical protein [Geothermobacter hydrogeniphilus]PNU19393.1 hypothetical protein C2E25_12490 [Geothermobacter hydrogeniphilus]